MLTWFDGPSVVISDGRMWPIITAKFDCSAIHDEFDELGITPEEASELVERLLCRVEEDMYEYMEDWVRDLRG